MTILTAFSQNAEADAAVKDIVESFQAVQPNVLIYFASPAIAPVALSAAMQDAFPDAVVFGCTTAGEIVSGRMLKGSLVAMAISEDVVPQVQVALLEEIDVDGETVRDHIKKVFQGFEDYYGEPVSAMDPGEYVGIILVDGLSLAEEKIMEKLGDLSDVIFIGASAGDDLAFEKTHVFAGGKAHSQAAVLALMKPARPFGFIKTQSFRVLDKTLVAGAVNEATREVGQFNGVAALQGYADALGVSAAEVPDHFMRNPLGLLVGDEPYVRSPQQVIGERVAFYCNVREGMELHLLEAGDMITDTRQAVEQAAEELGGISGLINFHCILRTLDLEGKGLTGEYGAIFADIPTIGFSTYGEQYIGHINQTSTMLAFK